MTPDIDQAALEALMYAVPVEGGGVHIEDCKAILRVIRSNPAEFIPEFAQLKNELADLEAEPDDLAEVQALAKDLFATSDALVAQNAGLKRALEIRRVQVECLKGSLKAAREAGREAQRGWDILTTDHRVLAAANDKAQEELAAIQEKCKTACGGSTPSSGYDYVDEVCGLLRVTRGQRDDAERELSNLRKKASP